MTVTNLGAAHLPLRDQVTTELRRRILTGELAPGERLIEDRLAEMLGVSRNPVREAIRVQTARFRAPHSWHEHLSLYAAIAAGNEDAAEESSFSRAFGSCIQPCGRRRAVKRSPSVYYPT